VQGQIPLEFESVTTSCGATGTAYIEATHELVVRFKTGTWLYGGVSHSEYMTLRHATSFGREWNQMKRSRGPGWGEKVA
jgi:hypothetical protein